MYDFYLAMTAENERFLRKIAFYNKNVKFLKTGVGVENIWTKVPKGTPLRQILSNKSFGVCASNCVLTLYGGEKKSTRERPL